MTDSGVRRASVAELAARLLVTVGLAAALVAGGLRYGAERRNRSVAITADYGEAVRLATGSGRSVREVLLELAAGGVTAVAITEDTLADLRDRGLAAISGTERLATVRLSDPLLLQRVAEAWQSRGLTPVPEPEPGGGPYTLLWCPQLPGRSVVFRGSIEALLTLGAGLAAAAVEDVRAARLECVARLSNFPGASEATLTRVLRDAAAAGAHIVICTGTEVLGYYGQARETARALDRAGMWFGQIEFGKQKGDAALATALRGRYIRVHSIPEGEMGTLSEPEAVDRFVRAARERNIRLCYIHLVTVAGSDAVAANQRYLASIAAGIRRGGLLRGGSARPFSDPGVPWLVYPFVGAAVAAFLVLLVFRMVPGAAARAWIWLAVMTVVCVVLALAGDPGRRLLALLAGVAAPTLGSLEVVRLVESPREDSHPLSRAVAALLRASAWTAAGIVCVVGLLASLPYMVQTRQFMGIKAAHALPLLLVATVLVVGLPYPGSGTSEAWKVMKQRAHAFFSQPVLVGALLGTLILLGGMMLALLRTGNEPGVGVSDLELRFRAILDAVLPARPRTKEFLIGHPAMVLAAFLALRGRRAWAAPFMVLGALGQASLLNTFCHIHTPLVISVVRAVTGLLLGCVLGTVLAGCVSVIEGRWRQAAASG